MPGIINRRNMLFCLLIIVIAAFYFYKINLFPEHDYDEAQMLNFHYRAYYYGDYRMPVVFQKAFNNEQSRTSPFQLADFFRELSHRLIGFSPQKTRIISAFMILSVVVVTGLICSSIFRSPWAAVLTLLVVGLTPNVVMAARTYRQEQEITFLGVLGMFGIPLVIRFVRSRYWRILLMFLGGVLLGWTATLHPWGMVFITVLFFTFVVYAPAWKNEDGFSLKARLFYWGGGAALPCLFILLIMTINWRNYSEFMSIMSQIYDVPDKIARCVALAPGWQGYLPPWLVAHVPFLNHYMIHRQAYFPFPKFYYLIFLIQITFVLFYSLYSLFTRKQTHNIFVVSAAWLAVGFMSMFLLYPPSSNYFLYPALAISLGFSFVVLTLWENNPVAKSWLSQPIRVVALVVFISLAAANSLYLIGQSYFIWHHSKTDKWVSLDTRFKAIEQMSGSISLNKQANPVLCDFMTWVGGGRHQGSLYETNVLMLTPAPQNLGGIIFELPGYQKFLFAFGHKFATIKEKFSRLKEMLAPLALAGVVFEEYANKSYYFYANKEQMPAFLRVGVIRGENDVVWGIARRDDDVIPVQVSALGQAGWRNLPEGLYVVRVSHSDDIDYTLRVLSLKNRNVLSEIRIAPQPIYRYVQRLVFLEIPKGGADVDLMAKGDKANADLWRLSQQPQ